jgi:hypothetical protein
MDADRRLTALESMRAAADTAKRTGNVGFPPSLIRSEDGAPGLARAIQGGQGGEVRLRLFLDIVMMATKQPHVLKQNSLQLQGWCRMLGLPEDSGRRRVSSNLRLLERDRLIRLEPRPGMTPVIHLLDPTDSSKPMLVRGGRYVGIPIEFWTHGWILDLSPGATVALFALSELLGGRQNPQYIARHRKAAYGLSADTWTKARKELETQGILTVDRIREGQGPDLRRLRNIYWLHREVLTQPRVHQAGQS